MKDFNEFIEYRKPLQRVMDGLSESDGIMLELMFYEFAKQQIAKAKNLPIADVVKSLPNDEEVKSYIGTLPYYGTCTTEYNEGFEDGVKWLKEQLAK